VGVVGKVPDLTGGVGVLAQDSQAFADVGEVGVGVGLVRIAQDAGGLAGQRGRDDPVAEDGLGAAAGPEVVRGPADGHLDVAGRMRRLELAGHAGPERAFLGVGGIGRVSVRGWPLGGPYM